MKIGFVSLGCAKNLVDSEYLIGLFDDPFFEYEADPKKCDAILINTCGFILSAKEEAIDTILEMAELKQKKLQYLIVTGCFSTRYYKECLEEFPEVDLFVRLDQYPDITKLLCDLFDHEFIYRYGQNRKLVTNNYSAYLKIGDGCDNRCAYCAIPLIRGNYHSYPLNDLVAEAQRLYELGVRELNVVAQDSTVYGRDIGLKPEDLLRKLDEIPFKWIRVLYMYPDEIEDSLLAFMAESKRVLPYFDIPIQYGNDEMLKLMNRRGSVALIKDRVAKIRELFKEPTLRTTLIVGFPHETDKSFNETVELIKELKFDSLGAFTFSKEEDTAAFDMDEDVSEELAKQRYDILMSAQQEIVLQKNEERLNKTYEVLIERYEELFDRYVARGEMSAPDGIDGVVYIKTNETLKIGSFVNVKIVAYDGYDLLGELFYNEEK